MANREGPAIRDQYVWRFRPLLIFGPSDDASILGRQRTIVEASSDGMLERDMVVVEIVGNRVKTIIGDECRVTAPELRARFQVPAEEFCVVLVGKDGGVKLREVAPVEATRLFALIDSMPMRQREITGQNRN